MTEVLAAIGGLVVLVLLVLAFAGLKVVREYQRLVVFRLGRTSGTKGPGLILINPITDRVSWVDLREQYLEIPHQTAITRDNASISIDFIIFFKVFDSLMSVLEVNDFKGAALNIA
ncbi:MAG: SPFH domain-containing protein, partial [Acidimicrobiales bacterium]